MGNSIYVNIPGALRTTMHINIINDNDYVYLEQRDSDTILIKIIRGKSKFEKEIKYHQSHNSEMEEWHAQNKLKETKAEPQQAEKKEPEDLSKEDLRDETEPETEDNEEENYEDKLEESGTDDNDGFSPAPDDLDHRY